MRQVSISGGALLELAISTTWLTRSAFRAMPYTLAIRRRGEFQRLERPAVGRVRRVEAGDATGAREL